MNFIKADPAGNITLIIPDEVPKHERAAISTFLIEQKICGAEQVGFVVPPLLGGLSRLEMMGGEFCGNATRAFGLYVAQKLQLDGELFVECTGCAHPIRVNVDRVHKVAEADMPLPVGLFQQNEVTLVEFEGICHAVIREEPSERRARALLERFGSGFDAFGVLFLTNAQPLHMTPWVFVRETSTAVWESSCASGSVAVAVACTTVQDGCETFEIHQPNGVITVEICREQGEFSRCTVGGSVTLSGELQATLPK